MMNTSSKVSTTIRLSDTADQWNRRVHVNVRNSKATMVYRWKSPCSKKDHTQRMTLTEAQAARLVAALTKAVGKATEGNVERRNEYMTEFFTAISE